MESRAWIRRLYVGDYPVLRLGAVATHDRARKTPGRRP